MNLKDKIIAFDLDGTLTLGTSFISDYSASVLEKLVKDGYLITLITGRQWTSAHDVYNKCHLHAITALGNGSTIYRPEDDTILYAHAMRKEFILDIDSDPKLNELINDIMFEYRLTSYSRNGYYKSNYGPTINGRFCDTMGDAIPTSVCILAKNQEVQEEIKKNIISKGYNYRYWGSFGEVYHFDFNKLDGAKVLVKQYNKTLADLIYFGDASNDVELLEASGIGIAMKNARDEVKGKANYVTDFTNDEDGAVKFLLKLIEQNEQN